MTTAHILGFPRIGAQRETKFALEAFWRNEINESELLATGSRIRRQNWQWQQEAGLDYVTAGDFGWYDPMLGTIALLGCLPRRFGFDPAQLTLPQYFELARGNATQPALEMTKWFDSNYHYLVPELDAESRFDGGVDWFFDEIADAQAAHPRVKAVLPGPLTFLWLAKSRDPGFDKLSLLARLLPAYRRILQQLAAKLPWAHHLVLLEKVKDRAARAWYAQAAVDNGWSRSVLALQIEQRAHRRVGKSVTYFAATLPPQQSDLAQQALRDPYVFDSEPSRKTVLYLSAVDDRLRHRDDQPSIGLLLCRGKNRLTVEYALRDVKKPIDVAEWRTRLVASLPKKLRSSLPTVAEIEAGLGKHSR